MKKPYPTDLSDAEWNYIEPHMPAPKGHGRPRIHDLREILKAIFYLLKSGCQWRLLPHDFPRWPTVYHYFRQWRIDGTWERINRAIRQRLRVRLNRDPQPSAGVVDSQSVKSTAVGGEDRGYDGGKKVKGRKRHILVDTEGFVLKAKVHSAKVMDYEGIKALLYRPQTQFPRLSHLWEDAGYRGEDKGKDWVEKTLGWSVDLVERPRQPAPKEVLMAWAKEWAVLLLNSAELRRILFLGTSVNKPRSLSHSDRPTCVILILRTQGKRVRDGTKDLAGLRYRLVGAVCCLRHIDLLVGPELQLP